MHALQLMPDTYFPSVSGNAFVARDFEKLFKAAGWQNSILMDNKSEHPNMYRHGDSYVYNFFGPDNRILPAAEALLQKESIDLLLLHDGDYPKFDKIITGTTRKKVIVHHYLKSPDDLRHNLEHFDAVIVFQKQHMDHYRGYGVKDFDRRIFYVPHPLDRAFMTDPDVQRKKKSVVYIGRVIPSKGIHRIFPYLEKFDLTMEVYGPTPDPSYLQILYHEGGDRVQIHQKVLNHDQMAQKFAESEIFFIGSTSECYSLVCQEAMAMGCKVIAKENAHAFDWAEGKLYKYHQERDLLEIIPKVLDNKNIEESSSHARSISDPDLAASMFKSVLSKIMTDDKACDTGNYLSSYMRVMGLEELSNGN